MNVCEYIFDLHFLSDPFTETRGLFSFLVVVAVLFPGWQLHHELGSGWRCTRLPAEW